VLVENISKTFYKM